VSAPDDRLVASLRLAAKETAALRRKNPDSFALTPEPTAVVGMRRRFRGGLEMFVLETDTGRLKSVLDDDIDLATNTELFENLNQELGR
jgi:hypothetical protein